MGDDGGEAMNRAARYGIAGSLPLVSSGGPVLPSVAEMARVGRRGFGRRAVEAWARLALAYRPGGVALRERTEARN